MRYPNLGAPDFAAVAFLTLRTRDIDRPWSSRQPMNKSTAKKTRILDSEMQGYITGPATFPNLRKIRQLRNCLPPEFLEPVNSISRRDWSAGYSDDDDDNDNDNDEEAVEEEEGEEEDSDDDGDERSTASSETSSFLPSILGC